MKKELFLLIKSTYRLQKIEHTLSAKKQLLIQNPTFCKKKRFASVRTILTEKVCSIFFPECESLKISWNDACENKIQNDFGKTKLKERNKQTFTNR